MWVWVIYTLPVQTMPDDIVQALSDALKEGDALPTIFSGVKQYLYKHLHDMYMINFSKRCAHMYCD